MVTPSPYEASTPQNTLQFLSSVLSQRGPSALPYSEDVKWLIRQHLVHLIQAHPSLNPKTAIFTHNDGTTVNLLQVDGTIPMVYQTVTYNIPVIIWLMETYPRYPPCVYVAPTRDMIIKRPHSHVNPSGLVSIPYLHNWIYPSYNLLDLVRHLGDAFGRDPPLYTRNSRQNTNPVTHSNPNSSLMNQHTQSASPSPRLNAHSGNPVIPPYGVRPLPSSQRPTMDDPNEVYKKNAINKLLESLHGDVAVLRKNREAEMEGLFGAQSVLRQKQEQLSRGLKEMQDEKEGLEQQLQMVLMNTDVLEAWLRDNEGKTGVSKGSFGVDEVFQPCDVMSKQTLECTASDLAIEDAIYSLDKAIQEGSIPADQYLKSIRSLSREQFFQRALCAKVRAAHLQAQVASMAARASEGGIEISGSQPKAVDFATKQDYADVSGL